MSTLYTSDFYTNLNNKKYRFGSFFASIILLSLLIVAGYSTIERYQEQRTIVQYGIQTWGTITKEYHRIYRNIPFYSYDIEYADNNGEVFVIKTSDEEQPMYRLGDQLYIRYLLDIPSRSRIDKPLEPPIMTLFIISCIALVLTTPLFGIMLWYYNNRWRKPLFPFEQE